MARAKTRTRAGSYVLDIYVPTPEGGRRRIQKSGFATVKEMEAEKARLMAEAASGVDLKAITRMTVGDLFDAFLAEKDALYAGKRETDGKAGAGTLRIYRQAFAHARPVIGTLPLSQLINSKPLDRVRDAMLAHPDLKVRTIRAYMQMVGWAMGWGVKKRLLARNVAKETALPPPAIKELLTLPTHAAMKAAIDACYATGDEGVTYGTLAYLLAVTGLRIGEAAALRWEHIDVKALTLRVVIGKTPRARRTMSISADDLTTLAPLRDRALLGGGFVFAESTGRVVSNRTAQLSFAAVDEAAGFHLHPHLLRHYHASSCIEAGMDFKSLQERLGHESITTTMNTYGHLRQDHDRDAAVRAGDFLRLAQ